MAGVNLLAPEVGVVRACSVMDVNRCAVYRARTRARRPVTSRPSLTADLGLRWRSVTPSGNASWTPSTVSRKPIPVRPNGIPALVVIKKTIWHDYLPDWILGMHGQNDANQPVALVQGRFDFPIQILAFVALRADQNNSARGASDVLLTNLPHYVFGVIALDQALQ